MGREVLANYFHASDWSFVNYPVLSLVDAESHAPIIMKQCPAARGFKKGYIQIELLFSALAVRKLKSRAE